MKTERAPMPAQLRLDRLWSIRERDGAVNATTVVGDPDERGAQYNVAITISRYV